jgi:ribosomal protein S18 acetylase RimI-like enzyme
MIIIREIEINDVDALFELRSKTRQNSMTKEELAALGITPVSIAGGLQDNLKGWLCEDEGTLAGFTMGDAATGEMMVIAILPEYENRGIGSQLMQKIETWLFSHGHKELWLSEYPDPALRAYHFYRHLGWKPTGIIKNEHQDLKKKRPDDDM